MSWSGMRSKLESEYLAASPRGYTQCYATSYSQYPDHERRVAIRPDGKEIIIGCCYNNWPKAALFLRDACHERRMREGVAPMDDTVVQFGAFDQQNFYRAFPMFDNQSIEESLAGENMLVCIFTVLNRRVGERRLEKIRQGIEGEEKAFREFFVIRTAAEGMIAEGEREGWEKK